MFNLCKFIKMHYQCVMEIAADSSALNCRYFVRMLLANEGIHKDCLPPYFHSWIQKESDLVMYTAEQLKKYKQAHLQSGCWYLDCRGNFTPSVEQAERTKHDGGVLVAVDIEEEETEEATPPLKKKRETRKEKAAREKLEKEQLALAEKETTEKERAAKEAAEKERVEKERAETEIVARQEEATRQEAAREESDEDDDDSEPPSEQGQGDCVTPQAPDSSISNVYHATARQLRKKKRDQFPSASSSIFDQESIEVYVECTSLSALADAAQGTQGTDPRWLRLHKTIAKVFLFSPKLKLVCM